MVLCPVQMETIETAFAGEDLNFVESDLISSAAKGTSAVMPYFFDKLDP